MPNEAERGELEEEEEEEEEGKRGGAGLDLFCIGRGEGGTEQSLQAKFSSS